MRSDILETVFVEGIAWGVVDDVTTRVVDGVMFLTRIVLDVDGVFVVDDGVVEAFVDFTVDIFIVEVCDDVVEIFAVVDI